MLVPQAKTAFSVFFVLFIIFAFFAYSSISIGLEQNRVQNYLVGFSATFSGLIVLALSIPLSNASVGIAIQSIQYLGIWGAIIIYLVLLFVIAYVIYHFLTKAMRIVFDRMTSYHPNDSHHPK